MTGALLCSLALVTTYTAARYRLGHALGVLLAWGYFYGILRARVYDGFTHFIFDAAVVGVYAVCLSGAARLPRLASPLDRWVLVLIAWPAALALLPVDPLPIQLVGLRYATFFLPMFMVGVRTEARDWQVLAYWLAGLNVAALVMAVLQYRYGIEAFIPRNATTELLYRSGVGGGLFRIPSTFPNAHCYGGMMVCTLPVLVGCYLTYPAGPLVRVLLVGGVSAAVAGGIISATRSNVVIAAAGFGVAWLVGGRHLIRGRMAVLVLIAVGVALYTTAGVDVRLQRFRDLEDTEALQERIGNPVTILGRTGEIVAAAPLGNGLARGFGISIPYFLVSKGLPGRRMILGGESELHRLAATQGLPGVLLWLAFFGWVFFRQPPRDPLSVLGYGISLASVLSGMSSAGVLSAVPMAPAFFLMMGWFCRRPAHGPILGLQVTVPTPFARAAPVPVRSVTGVIGPPSPNSPTGSCVPSRPTVD
jgi:hypothetical protein